MKRKVLVVLAIAVLISSLAMGCSSTTGSSTATKSSVTTAPQATTAASASVAAQTAVPTTAKKIKVGFTAMNLTSEFHIAARDTLEKLCKEKGYEFVSVDGNNDNQKQINAIEDMITGGVNVLVLCPVSRDGILPALQACEKAGVMVIGYDSKATDTQYLTSYIASDNVQAGRLTGEYLLKKYPKGGTLAIIDNQKAESVVSRVNGLKEALKGSNIEIVADDNISSLQEVLTKVEDNLQKRPNLTFYWALNDDVALSAIGAIQTAGAKTVVIGVDGNPSGKKAVKEGIYLATAAQSPVGIAKKVFEVMELKLAGKSVEKEYLINTFIIDKDNVDQYGIDSWQ